MPRTQDVTIPVEGERALHADILVPAHPAGLVIFAHGSGSSRFSPRNRQVAQALNRARMATLLADLLTPDEESLDSVTAQFRFDIPLLARRLVAVIDHAASLDEVHDLPVGLFGASTGAAAALIAAAARAERIAAVVSRGGRPDLAGDALERVRAPTLLIVGGLDTAVLELNQQARSRMRTRTSLSIVEGATHLFEESGALERVERLAAQWFSANFSAASERSSSTSST